MSFKGVFADLVKGAEAFKAEFLKLAGEAPGALAKIEADAPILSEVTSAIFPGSATVIATGTALAESVADVIEAGGDAAVQNLTNAGLDVAAINQVKSLVAQTKSLKA